MIGYKKKIVVALPVCVLADVMQIFDGRLAGSSGIIMGRVLCRTMPVSPVTPFNVITTVFVGSGITIIIDGAGVGGGTKLLAPD